MNAAPAPFLSSTSFLAINPFRCLIRFMPGVFEVDVRLCCLYEMAVAGVASVWADEEDSSRRLAGSMDVSAFALHTALIRRLLREGVILQTLMPMEGNSTEVEQDEQVGKVWEHFCEHIVLKMAAAKVINQAADALHASFYTVQKDIAARSRTYS